VDWSSLIPASLSLLDAVDVLLGGVGAVCWWYWHRKDLAASNGTRLGFAEVWDHATGEEKKRLASTQWHYVLVMPLTLIGGLALAVTYTVWRESVFALAVVSIPLGIAEWLQHRCREKTAAAALETQWAKVVEYEKEDF